MSIQLETRKIPGNPPGGSGEGVAGKWVKSTLSDFTDQQWGDLSGDKRRSIAQHFAFYFDLDTFGALKLPHHFPPNHANKGKASLNGVRNSLSRLSAMEGISDTDRDRIEAHLHAHLPEEKAAPPPDMERRWLPAAKAELRVEQVDGQDYLTGYAAVFDIWSEDLGGFREQIAQGAFADVLKKDPDVVFVPDHRYSVPMLLGRTRSGTLSLAEDKVGLKFRAAVPNTQNGRDVRTLVKRGDADGMSFAFYLREDEGGRDRWYEEDSEVRRIVLAVSELVDVAIVTHPAYPTASVEVSQRSLDAASKTKTPHTPFRRLNAEVDLQRMLQ